MADREIPRFHQPRQFLLAGKPMQRGPEGQWVIYEDHLAALQGAESRCEELEEAAQAAVEAHRSVIEGVTPDHPNWCGGQDREEYEAVFSRWHSTTRKLRTALQSHEQEERTQ